MQRLGVVFIQGLYLFRVFGGGLEDLLKESRRNKPTTNPHRR